MKIPSLFVVFSLLIPMNSSCGFDRSTSSDPAGLSSFKDPPVLSSPSSATKVFSGTAYNGKVCTLKLDYGLDGQVTDISMTEDFKVDYKLPAPGSGLFGVYYWPQTLSSDVHLGSGEWSVKRSLLRDADVVEGRGKPLFWDGNHHHKMVFKPSIEAPKTVTYRSVDHILGAVPFVVIDGLCSF